MKRPGPSESALRELARVLSRLDSASEVYEVLYALLTARERDKIALRWRLVELLERGVAQRTIAAELGISLCKITRGSHELKYGPKGFRKAIRRAVKQQGQG
jgi:TrpR family trp operon transcriptional repressor